MPCLPKYVRVKAQVTNGISFLLKCVFFFSCLPSEGLSWPEEMQALGQPQKFSAVPRRILMRGIQVSKNKNSLLYIVMSIFSQPSVGLFHMGYHTLHLFTFIFLSKVI